VASFERIHGSSHRYCYTCDGTLGRSRDFSCGHWRYRSGNQVQVGVWHTREIGRGSTTLEAPAPSPPISWSEPGVLALTRVPDAAGNDVTLPSVEWESSLSDSV